MEGSSENKVPDPYFDLIMNEELAKNEFPAALDEIHKNTEH